MKIDLDELLKEAGFRDMVAKACEAYTSHPGATPDDTVRFALVLSDGYHTIGAATQDLLLETLLVEEPDPPPST